VSPHPHDLTQVTPHIFVWQHYDPDVKADLFSTALQADTGIYFIDPIPLTPAELVDPHLSRSPAGIFVTNVNHLRASTALAAAFSIPIYANEELSGTPNFPMAHWVGDGESFSPGLTAISIPGGPAGETAVYHRDNGGTIVIGDAIINFEPYGFSLPPAKYCLNFKRMQKSLRKLLDYRFQRVLFAHGTPIVSDGFLRLERLLTDRGC